MTKKNISPEDSDLFRRTVGPVRAVNNDRVECARVAKPNHFRRPAAANEEEPADYGFGDYEKIGGEDALCFNVPGLQKNVLVRLRKGHFAPGARLDLHGLTWKEAKTRLARFLDRCVEDGCRCVILIHGKGSRSAGQHPVLKNNLNHWLRRHDRVLAFCSAAPREGGAGALWLLLRVSDRYRAPTR